ncbi:MAG: hypothetical protein EKK55_07065 [Rhodocyclaceae bacterium]|nr:MAG: hypothetical protein EKK55_07065 [Rhodocyclaceae bacterium]
MSGSSGFREGTQVRAPAGEVALERLVPGDVVVGCDDEPTRVHHVIRTRAKRWVRLQTASGAVLIATFEQAVLMIGGWARATTLAAADGLVMFAAGVGTGGAGALWGSEREWLGRRGSMDRRALRGGPYPVPNLRKAARVDPVVSVARFIEPSVAIDLVLEQGGGYVAGGFLARSAEGSAPDGGHDGPKRAG